MNSRIETLKYIYFYLKINYLSNDLQDIYPSTPNNISYLLHDTLSLNTIHWIHIQIALFCVCERQYTIEMNKENLEGNLKEMVNLLNRLKMVVPLTQSSLDFNTFEICFVELLMMIHRKQSHSQMQNMFLFTYRQILHHWTVQYAYQSGFFTFFFR